MNKQTIKEFISDLDKKGLQIYGINVFLLSNKLKGYKHLNRYEYDTIELDPKVSNDYKVMRNNKNEITLQNLENYLKDKEYRLQIGFHALRSAESKYFGRRIFNVIRIDVIIEE